MNITQKGLNWLKKLIWRTPTKHIKKRPHFYSKNAWSYHVRGKLTPAKQLLIHLGAL